MKNPNIQNMQDRHRSSWHCFQDISFSQTDVLRAYEQFEAWCLNKNILKAYDYNFSEDFLLDRDENEVSAYEKLNNMIGLKIVKEQIDKIITADIVEKERKNEKEMIIIPVRCI